MGLGFPKMNDVAAKVSVIGLGKLGFPLAACFAARGCAVIGVDQDPMAVELVNSGGYPEHEPGVAELLQSSECVLKATLDIKEAVLNSDVTLVIVPTPSGPDGKFSNQYVLDVCGSIAAGIAEKGAYHLVVLISTVMPGSTGGVIQGKLEKDSGLTCGADFGLCYVPSFVALGSVVRNFLRPDYLLVGESDPIAGDVLEKLYSRVCENEPSLMRMNFVNAEVTKLATNAFVSTKITFGNMLAQVCEGLPEAHVDKITAALGMDTRIGEKYLKGGIGYGGPCLVRDNVALAALADSIGSRALLAEATHQANQQEVSRLANLIKSKRADGGTVGILGLSYKPGTDVVESSQGLLLAQELASEGIPVATYDPEAMNQAKRFLDASVRYCESAEDCIQQSNLVVITTPWEEFKELDPGVFGKSGTRVLVDCWRIMDETRFSAVANYIPLGVGPVSSR